jgi:hypothetical protein
MVSDLVRRSIFLATVLAVTSQRAMAQASTSARKPPDVSVVVSRDRLDVRFPAIALGNTGCMETNKLPSGATGRWYEWQATADFPDRKYPNNHFMSVLLFFGLPEDTPLTAARLDSAIAATPITVDEAQGEPPMTARQWKPARAWARREGGRLHLHVEGSDAVHAFLSTGADSASVLWCQRDESMSFVQARLQR